MVTHDMKDKSAVGDPGEGTHLQRAASCAARLILAHALAAAATCFVTKAFLCLQPLALFQKLLRCCGKSRPPANEGHGWRRVRKSLRKRGEPLTCLQQRRKTAIEREMKALHVKSQKAPICQARLLRLQPQSLRKLIALEKGARHQLLRGA